MDEEIDTRKINNSFLRDHNYATEADIISTVEFNPTGELLATGDKGGRVVVFQREQESKNQPHRRGEYNVYSTLLKDWIMLIKTHRKNFRRKGKQLGFKCGSIY
nr:Protein phosphatase 2 (formerly 2A), regulatory subunit B (PR 52), beta isoform [Danio rerio]